MRQYFSEANFVKAISLAIPLTLMSAPRILYGGFDPLLFLPAAFISLTLLSGMATAWSRHGRLPGLFPARRALLGGLGAAIALTVVVAPLAYFFIDPVMRQVVADTGSERLLRLEYPESARETIALVLWVAGFQVAFFVAASMSFFARLLHSRWAALAAAVAVRAFVAHLQVARGHLGYGAALFLVDTSATTALSCWLFARFGLLPPVLFALLVNLRLFFPPWS